MQFITKIDEKEQERVEIYANKRTSLIDQIESLCKNDELQIFGYLDDEIYILDINEIERVFVEGDKVFASLENTHYRLKTRLYLIEEQLGDNFIKINHSCLVNKNFINCFKTSWKGSLLVQLKNGEKDFVSRRQTKAVMERMGIK